MTAEQLAEARAWVAECVWMEAADDLAAMTDAQIERGIAKHYAGGIGQFITDCQSVEIGGAL